MAIASVCGSNEMRAASNGLYGKSVYIEYWLTIISQLFVKLTLFPT
jgi:hypothetical protein